MFGMAGTFKDTPANPPKMRERGCTGLFVGYQTDSSGDCMIIVDPKNKFQKYFTRDVTWLKRNYYQRNPNEPKNGRVLTITGLDNSIFEQGSVVGGPDKDNQPDQPDIAINESQRLHFQTDTEALPPKL